MLGNRHPYRDQRERGVVKTLAFVIGLCIIAVGAVGILAPSGLVWIAHHADAPVDLYVIAAIRVAFGVLLLSVAPASRAPRTLRAVAVIPLVAAIATPFVGVERARATIEWWTQQGPGSYVSRAFLYWPSEASSRMPAPLGAAWRRMEAAPRAHPAVRTGAAANPRCAALSTATVSLKRGSCSSESGALLPSC